MGWTTRIQFLVRTGISLSQPRPHRLFVPPCLLYNGYWQIEQGSVAVKLQTYSYNLEVLGSSIGRDIGYLDKGFSCVLCPTEQILLSKYFSINNFSIIVPYGAT
jgi:hypothetical protein